MMQRWMRAVALGLWIVGGVMLLPRAASAGYLNDAGLGVASALSTFVYAPLKISYAIVGGVFGSMGYLLSVGSLDVAKKIWVPSLGGSYVITPDMLQGDEEIRFFGSETAETGSVEVVE
jgi:hypothetical protein